MKISKCLLAAALFVCCNVHARTEVDFYARSPSISEIKKIYIEHEMLNIQISGRSIDNTNSEELSQLISERAEKLIVNFTDGGFNKVAVAFLSNLSLRKGTDVTICIGEKEYVKALENFLHNNRTNINVIEVQLGIEIENSLLQNIANELTNYKFIDLIGSESTITNYGRLMNENARKLRKLLKGKNVRIIDETGNHKFVNGKWEDIEESEKEAVENVRNSVTRVSMMQEGLKEWKSGGGEKFVQELKKKVETAKDWQNKLDEADKNVDLTERLKLANILFGDLTEEIISFLTKEDCEKAVKNGIIHQEQFFTLSVGNTEFELIDAAKEILAVVGKKNSASVSFRLGSKMLSNNPAAALRVLVREPLFSNVDFVKSIKPQLRAFHEKYKADYEENGKPKGHPYLRFLVVDKI